MEWLPNERGVHYRGIGSIASRDEFPPLSHLSTDGSLTVEIAVRPSRLTNRYVPYILTFHQEQGPPPLAIGLWKSSLIVRLGRAGGTQRGKYREIGVAEAFVARETTVVTVVTGPQGTAMYLNGRLQRSVPDAVLEEREANLGRLLLGISPTGEGEWRGDILEFKIYNRALTEEEVLGSYDALIHGQGPEQAVDDSCIAGYDFSENCGEIVHNSAGPNHDLIIPGVFRPLKRVFLGAPADEFRWKLSALGDIVLNILGFIPYAFLATWTLGTLTGIQDRWKSVVVVGSGFLLSLAVELAQAFLPTRSSTLTDLFTNTLGAAVGVVVYYCALLPSSDASTDAHR